MRALFIIWLLVSAGTLHAQTLDGTADFTIQFDVSDSESPTTPTLLSATPISDDQIDLLWNASTDNVLVAGYTVSRDSVVVATTTLTNFSDTGLVASTTYMYSIRAFDLAGNYSSSSNSLSTTTLEAVVPTTGSGAGGGTRVELAVRDFLVAPGFSTSSLTASMNLPARFEVRWGRSVSYELGYIATDFLTRDYNAQITELEPGTTYEYEMIAVSRSGQELIVDRGQFTTISLVDSVTPANVRNFVATAVDDSVLLEWDTRGVPPDAEVRIVRSPFGYPAFPNDGAIVYQGMEESFFDPDILGTYSPVYYTAFVINASGNVSSGAIAAAVRQFDRGDTTLYPPQNVDHPELDQTSPTPGESTEDRVPDVQLPSLDNILLVQGGKTFSLNDTDIVLDASESLLITIARTNVTPHIKSIIATLTDPTDVRRSFSFLLRINKDHTAYEATLSPLRVAGQSSLQVEIYDLESYVVGRYKNSITFETKPTDDPTFLSFLGELFSGRFLISLAGLLVTLGLLTWLVFATRRDTDQDPVEGNS